MNAVIICARIDLLYIHVNELLALADAPLMRAIAFRRVMTPAYLRFADRAVLAMLPSRCYF